VVQFHCARVTQVPSEFQSSDCYNGVWTGAVVGKQRRQNTTRYEEQEIEQTTSITLTLGARPVIGTCR
jgi:hypothetical protein